MTQSVVKETILTETMSCSRHTLDEKNIKNGAKLSAGVKRSLRVCHEATAGGNKPCMSMRAHPAAAAAAAAAQTFWELSFTASFDDAVQNKRHFSSRRCRVFQARKPKFFFYRDLLFVVAAVHKKLVAKGSQ